MAISSQYNDKNGQSDRNIDYQITRTLLKVY